MASSTETRLSPSKKRGMPILDFFMCWVALCGLFNVAIGMASFVYEINIRFNGALVTTSMQRYQWIATYFALSAAGFTYMLWRQKWHCRLSALILLVTIWCVVFAAAPMFQGDRSVQGIVAIACISLFMLAYAAIWSFLQSHRSVEESQARSMLIESPTSE